jgi:hypothetical protein
MLNAKARSGLTRRPPRRHGNMLPKPVNRVFAFASLNEFVIHLAEANEALHGSTTGNRRDFPNTAPTAAVGGSLRDATYLGGYGSSGLKSYGRARKGGCICRQAS